MNILQETKFLMKKYNIKTNKNLGQNFLIDENVINSIVEASNIQPDDLVIEIGPGLGTLTHFLLEKAKKVICIELDNRMVEILKDRFKLYSSFEIIHGDILKLDLKSLVNENRSKYNSIKVVANLPYYITTGIVTKLLEDELDLESITIMIQKEVADRLLGKNVGAITYCINYYCESESIIEVPNTSFIPSPQVTSEVIKLTLRKAPLFNVDKSNLFKIIKFAFMQRRKTLINSLTNSKIFTSKDEAIQVLQSLNIDINSRPENLNLSDFVNISKKTMH